MGGRQKERSQKDDIILKSLNLSLINFIPGLYHNKPPQLGHLCRIEVTFISDLKE
ncbi:MAG: hypothetical protein P8Y70_02000 [Candidatus Lokiarchaeota archaeon]